MLHGDFVSGKDGQSKDDRARQLGNNFKVWIHTGKEYINFYFRTESEALNYKDKIPHSFMMKL